MKENNYKTDTHKTNSGPQQQNFLVVHKNKLMNFLHAYASNTLELKTQRVYMFPQNKFGQLQIFLKMKGFHKSKVTIGGLRSITQIVQLACTNIARKKCCHICLLLKTNHEAVRVQLLVSLSQCRGASHAQATQPQSAKPCPLFCYMYHNIGMHYRMDEIC